jgi:hypothetical protein
MAALHPPETIGWVPAMTAVGQQGPFRPSRLSVRCRLGERTLAGTRSNDQDAPIPAVR